jgi:uncharacterized protein (TIGR02118 family)
MFKRVTMWNSPTGVDPESALAQWMGAHVRLVVAVPGVRRYVQNRCVRGPSGGGVPFTGIGELWFDGPEDAATALATPEWQAVIADAATFMDMDRIVAAGAEEYPASPDASG